MGASGNINLAISGSVVPLVLFAQSLEASGDVLLDFASIETVSRVIEARTPSLLRARDPGRVQPLANMFGRLERNVFQH